MTTKYMVKPTSQTGQSILESVERRGGNNVIAEVSLQMPTDKAEEIALAVNSYQNMVDALTAIALHQQLTVEPTAEGFQRIARMALAQPVSL